MKSAILIGLFYGGIILMISCGVSAGMMAGTLMGYGLSPTPALVPGIPALLLVAFYVGFGVYGLRKENNR